MAAATTLNCTLSLHDALPIYAQCRFRIEPNLHAAVFRHSRRGESLDSMGMVQLHHIADQFGRCTYDQPRELPQQGQFVYRRGHSLERSCDRFERYVAEQPVFGGSKTTYLCAGDVS